jgi:hypothetical protein
VIRRAAVASLAVVMAACGSASTDADALPDVIAGLRGAGYGFATPAQIL